MHTHTHPHACTCTHTLHKTSMGVESFFSLIFSYFCFFVAAFSPCHGKLVRLKYIKTYPILSMSSRRLHTHTYKGTPCDTNQAEQTDVTVTPENMILIGMMAYDCSIPKWALTLAYLAVPVKFLSSRYMMCILVLASLYFLASPKSIMNSWCHKCVG